MKQTGQSSDPVHVYVENDIPCQFTLDLHHFLSLRFARFSSFLNNSNNNNNIKIYLDKMIFPLSYDVITFSRKVDNSDISGKTSFILDFISALYGIQIREMEKIVRCFMDGSIGYFPVPSKLMYSLQISPIFSLYKEIYSAFDLSKESISNCKRIIYSSGSTSDKVSKEYIWTIDLMFPFIRARFIRYAKQHSLESLTAIPEEQQRCIYSLAEKVKLDEINDIALSFANDHDYF